jgi:hypothetical protein
MRRLAMLLCGALLAAGPASAMRAHDYIDEQRGPVTLPAEQAAPSLNIERPLDTAAVVSSASDAQLHVQQSAQAAPPGQPQPLSPVPEPSGWAMLVCGALLLALMPRKRDESSYAIRR